MDLATLGLAVDSKPVKAANDDLKDFQKAAQGAEKAADGFSNGADKAGNAAKRMQKDIDGAEKSFSSLKIAAIAAGAAIGAALGAGLASAVNRIEAVNVAMRKIDKALALNGYSYDVTGVKIKKFADDLERATGRAAQDVLNIAPNLASFGFTDEVFFRAIKLANDMSAAWGGDLKQNLEGLSRALADPVKGFAMLSQRGITLTDTQKKLAKSLMESGQGLKAQGVVFGALESQISGVAESGFAGLTKATANARLALEGFFEAIVVKTGLMTALEVALNAVATALDYLTEHMGTILAVLASVGTGLAIAFGPAIIGAVGTLAVLIGGTLVGAVAALTAALLANPLGLLVAGIGLAITAAYAFRDEIQKAIGVDVIELAKNAGNMIINSFVAAYEDIKTLWMNFPDVIGAAVIGAVNAVVTGVGKMVNVVIDSINEMIKAISGLTAKLGIDLGTGIEHVKFDAIPNEYADRLGKVLDDRNKKIAETMGTDRLGQLSNLFNPSTPAAPAAGGPLKDREFGSEGKMSSAAKAYRDLIKHAQDRIDQMKLEAETAGLNGVAADTMRFKLELLQKAQDKGRTITAAQRAEIEALSVAYGKAAEAAAKASLTKDLMFDRDQMGRSAIDQTVASTLRGAGLEIDFNSYEAGLIRTNEQLKEARSLAGDFVSTFRQGLEGGKSVWEAFGDAAMSVLDKITDKLLNDVLNALFEVNKAGSGSGGGLFGFLGSLLGGGSSSAAADPWAGMRMADGGAFTGGVQKFANGGTFTNSIVSSPTLFKFASGTGLMGEAGPEAIMPLKRDSSGRLGVSAGGGMVANNNQPQEVLLRVVGEEGPMFRPTIRAESESVSVRVVTENNAAQQNYRQNGGQ